MPYYYYEAQIRYPSDGEQYCKALEKKELPQRSRAEKFIIERLKPNKVDCLISRNLGDGTFYIYLRTLLNLQEFGIELRKIFNLPEKSASLDNLPEICPISWHQETAFFIPEYLELSPNSDKENIQDLFMRHSPFTIPQYMDELTPTNEELETLSEHRAIKNRKSIYAIALYCGYAESAKVAPLIIFYNGREPHKDAVLAFKALANSFRKKYQILLNDCCVGRDFTLRDKPCCMTTKKEDSEKHFCKECKNPLNSEAFDPEQFSQWIYDISGENCDGYGGDDLEDWWEFDGVSRLMQLPPEAVIEIGENAEHLLTLCVDPKNLTGESRQRQEAWIKNRTEESLSKRIKRVSEKKGKFS